MEKTSIFTITASWYKTDEANLSLTNSVEKIPAMFNFPEHHELTKALIRNTQQMELLGNLQNAHGLWYNIKTKSTHIEPAITGKYKGSVEQAYTFAESLAEIFNQEAIQIVFTTGDNLDDYQIAYFITAGQESQTLKTLLSIGIRGASIEKDSLIINIKQTDFERTFQTIREAFGEPDRMLRIRLKFYQ